MHQKRTRAFNIKIVSLNREFNNKITQHCTLKRVLFYWEVISMDNFNIIYKILKQLEKAMDYDEFDMETVSAERLKNIRKQTYENMGNACQ